MLSSAGCFSSGTSARHIGQLVFLDNHVNMHDVWNLCLHLSSHDGFDVVSPSQKDSKQIGHNSSSSSLWTHAEFVLISSLMKECANLRATVEVPRSITTFILGHVWRLWPGRLQ